MSVRRDGDEDSDLIRYICETDAFRRELLWLRARERDDATSAALLEREDPGLCERIRGWAALLGTSLEIEDRIERVRTYHTLWGQRFELIRRLRAADLAQAEAA